jgi:hypothetical protein
VATPKQRQVSSKTQNETPFWRWFFGHVFSLLRRYGSLVVIWTGIGYCIHELAKAFEAYAGQTSFADLGLKIGVNISVVWAVSISVAGLSMALYLKERKLHRSTRERLTARITALELRLDPKRTSSHLTPED